MNKLCDTGVEVVESVPRLTEEPTDELAFGVFCSVVRAVPEPDALGNTGDGREESGKISIRNGALHLDRRFEGRSRCRSAQAGRAQRKLAPAEQRPRKGRMGQTRGGEGDS